MSYAIIGSDHGTHLSPSRVGSVAKSVAVPVRRERGHKGEERGRAQTMPTTIAELSPYMAGYHIVVVLLLFFILLAIVMKD